MRIRAAALCLSACVLCACLSGCWDYQGLDHLTIVAGIAIDQGDADPDSYRMTFEIVDAKSADDKGKVGSYLLETEGKSVFQAVRMATRKLRNEMYFGNLEVLVISHQCAQGKGINHILDAFLRDFSTRDTVAVVVSGEDTACDILKPVDDKKKIIAYDLNDSINRGKYTVNSARVLELYEIYDCLSRSQEQLALPILHFTGEGEERTLALDGMAVFEKDKMVSRLKADAAPFYMLCVEKLSGGVYTFFLRDENSGENMDVTLSLTKSQPTLKYQYDGKKMTLIANVEATTSAIELSPLFEDVGGQSIEALEKKAEESLSRDIRHVIEGMQSGSGADIFGFAYEIYKKDHKLWSAIRNDWPSLFRGAEIQVRCKILINDTGFIKKYEGART